MVFNIEVVGDLDVVVKVVEGYDLVEGVNVGDGYFVIVFNLFE